MVEQKEEFTFHIYRRWEVGTTTPSIAMTVINEIEIDNR